MSKEVLTLVPHNRKTSLFAKLKQLLNEADEADPFAATEALESAAELMHFEARRVAKHTRRPVVA